MMWKIIVQPDTPHVTIQFCVEKIRFGFQITKARIQPCAHNI